MAAEPRVLVTRPAGQADSLAAGLRERGFEPVHWPMLAIVERDPLPGDERQRLLNLDRYQHVVFISANAARVGVNRIAEYWPQLPAQQQYWAVGISTARVLDRAGIRASFPEQDMSSDGLLALPALAELSDQKMLIVKGEGGREVLATRLRERGAEVDALHCYRRGPVAYDAQECLGFLAHTYLPLILVSSGEGLVHLSSLLRPQEHTNLAEITLVVPSPRVFEQARQLGWKRVERAENASDSAMLMATERWRSAHLGEIKH